VSLPNSKIGCHIWVRLQRIAAVGLAPTANPWCTMLQAHIQVDTIGSKKMSSKW